MIKLYKTVIYSNCDGTVEETGIGGYYYTRAENPVIYEDDINDWSQTDGDIITVENAVLVKEITEEELEIIRKASVIVGFELTEFEDELVLSDEAKWEAEEEDEEDEEGDDPFSTVVRYMCDGGIQTVQSIAERIPLDKLNEHYQPDEDFESHDEFIEWFYDGFMPGYSSFEGLASLLSYEDLEELTED